MSEGASDASWKKISSTDVIRDRWLRLRADRCQLPSGIIVEPFYVIEGNACSIVFVTDDQNRVLLVRHYRYPIDAVGYELPGGNLNLGEDVLIGAQRELLEECGCVAENWRVLSTHYADPCRGTTSLHLCVANRAKIVSATQLDAEEHIIAEFVPPAQVFELMRNGGIHQCMQVGLLHVAFAELGWCVPNFPK